MLLEILGRVEKVTVKYELEPETHARWKESDPNFQDLIKCIDGIIISSKVSPPSFPSHLRNLQFVKSSLVLKVQCHSIKTHFPS